MALENYMKRISFLDGQVLHDFHLNTMQSNIAQAIKLKTMYERYDMLLMVSNYNLYFAEPFIDTKYRDPSSSAALNTITYSISADSWITPLLGLPSPTTELYLLSSYEDNPANGATITFSYRTANGQPWIKMSIDKPVYFDTPISNVQLKVDCNYTGTTRPIVYDYCLFWK
jgi:hypothetical protein